METIMEKIYVDEGDEALLRVEFQYKRRIIELKPWEMRIPGELDAMFSFLSSKPLTQPYLQFWRLILKINVSTASANATVCTWKVMTCMADSGTWYCRTYGTSRGWSSLQKFRLFQKLGSLGFQLQKWRILMSKAIDGEVSHHTDKYCDMFLRAVIKQSISRGKKAIAVNIYNLSDLIAVTWFHREVKQANEVTFLGM